MLNKGKYYELLMEKHNMTYKEKKLPTKWLTNLSVCTLLK